MFKKTLILTILFAISANIYSGRLSNVNLYAKNPDGLNMLQQACCSEKIDLRLIEYLLKQGVDPNIENENGDTPLILLVKNHGMNRKAVAAVELLIKHGANILAINKQGFNIFGLDCSNELDNFFYTQYKEIYEAIYIATENPNDVVMEDTPNEENEPDLITQSDLSSSDNSQDDSY